MNEKRPPREGGHLPIRVFAPTWELRKGYTAKPSKNEDNRTKQTTCHKRNKLKTNKI